jgi:DNA-binding NtrC family response regulator
MMLPATASSSNEAPALLGESAAMLVLRREIDSAARTQAKVLILGETGVGKEVVANLIHAGSARRTRSFVAVNCSGIPETLLESELFGHTKGSFTGAYRDKLGLVQRADRGTLFLDELGEMSFRMQAVLLRFAETGEIQRVGSDGPTGRSDVRLITATNRDLRAQIAAGAFREDLYYRLNVMQIRIPPLRERRDDVLLLVRYYLQRASQSYALPCPDVSPGAAELFMTYPWPGNVRELKNVTERLVVRELGRTVTPDHVPEEIRGVTVATTVAAPPPVRSGEATPIVDPQGSPVSSETVNRLWAQLLSGKDFWTSVHSPFKAHQLTRNDLRALIDRGLQHTRGNYRALIRAFNLPDADYKRFHAFLSQHQCRLPVAPYRRGERPPTDSDGQAIVC